jgi:G:T-mismatch repair DNA endonuclease (very short patch repair protein)
MGTKLILDEDFIINEYEKGKSSLVLEKELGVSKPTILKILKKHGVTKKRDRCKSLNIKEESNRFIIIKKCPKCQKDIQITSNNPTIACRNYFNSVSKKSLCKKCSLELQKGEGNPFYGKKHSKKSLTKMSKSKKGQNMGDKNHMKQERYRQMSRDIMRSNWDNGILDRKVMSDKMKETRRSGKLKSVIRSKKEKEIVVEIRKMGYVVQHSLRVETKIYDIFISSLNLVIEYNGDYWHCNPKKYKPDYFNQKKQKTAKELWEYDKNKIDLIREKGYNLEIVWESDLKMDHTLIYKLIKKYDKR